MRKMSSVIDAHTQAELEEIRKGTKCGWCKHTKKVFNLLCDQCADEDVNERAYKAK